MPRKLSLSPGRLALVSAQSSANSPSFPAARCSSPMASSRLWEHPPRSSLWHPTLRSSMLVAALSPGFVDAHTHLVFAGNRADEFELRCTGVTYQEIAKQGGGIRSTVRRTRAASEDDLLAVGQKHASWFLRGGTTTIEAKSGYGLTVEAEMKILRVVRLTG